MKRWITRLITFMLMSTFALGSLHIDDAEAQTRVRGYTRKDGTYVRAHTRGGGSSARAGTRSGGTYVRGYTRRDGTYVRAHTRGGGLSRDYDSSNSETSGSMTSPDSSTSLSETYPAAPAYSEASTETRSEAVAGSSQSLANTGGAPWMMVLAGSTLSLGGLALRRRLA